MSARYPTPHSSSTYGTSLYFPCPSPSSERPPLPPSVRRYTPFFLRLRGPPRTPITSTHSHTHTPTRPYTPSLPTVRTRSTSVTPPDVPSSDPRPVNSRTERTLVSVLPRRHDSSLTSPVPPWAPSRPNQPETYINLPTAVLKDRLPLIPHSFPPLTSRSATGVLRRCDSRFPSNDVDGGVWGMGTGVRTGRVGSGLVKGSKVESGRPWETGVWGAPLHS